VLLSCQYALQIDCLRLSPLVIAFCNNIEAVVVISTISLPYDSPAQNIVRCPVNLKLGRTTNHHRRHQSTLALSYVMELNYNDHLQSIHGVNRAARKSQQYGKRSVDDNKNISNSVNTNSTSDKKGSSSIVYGGKFKKRRHSPMRRRLPFNLTSTTQSEYGKFSWKHVSHY
jgi:hypothetical protein